MWCYLEQVGSLVQCLPHQLVLPVVQTEDGLLQVAHTSVDQLGAAATRARGEVEAFHQRRAKPCERRDSSCFETAIILPSQTPKKKERGRNAL